MQLYAKQVGKGGVGAGGGGKGMYKSESGNVVGTWVTGLDG